MASDVGVRLGVDGEKAFRDSLKAVNSQIKALGAEMTSVTASFLDNASSQQALAAKNAVLSRSIEASKSKVGVLTKELENQRAKLDGLGQALERAEKEFGKNSQQALTAQNAYNKQAKTVNDLAAQLHKAEAQVSEMTHAVEENKRAMEGSGDGMEELAEGAEQAAKALDKGGKSTLNFGDLLKANLLSDAIAAGARKLADALEAVGRAALDLGRQSLEGFSQFEQLSGGVKTLLGTEAGSLEEYANSVGKSVEEARAEYERLLSSQQLVFANADRAFQSAGLSANEYMETVTGFAASLLQGLGGDTVEAARLADLAITDMADNANKMGTDMQSIQNAYQGFAKQNYTMLDNLKLGYGGTQEEMIRLINDSGVLTETISDLDNVTFDQIIQAINAVQTSMGITGTTAKEAATTVEGSANAMKAAWSNLVTGIAQDDADISGLMSNFTESLGTAAGNVLPRVETIVAGIGTLVEQLGAQLGEQAPMLVENVLPAMIGAGGSLVEGIASGVLEALPGLQTAAGELFQSFIGYLQENLPQLISTGLQSLLSFSEGFRGGVGALVDNAIELVMTLADGIIEALPDLIATVPEIISNFAGAINDNAPKLLVAAAQLIAKLVQGLIENIPVIIQNLPKIIMAIWDTITAVNWINLGASIIKGLVNGIKNMIAGVKNIGGQVVEAVKGGFKNLPNALKDIGKNIIQGLINGIKSMAGAVKDNIVSIASNAVNTVKNFLGIHSPSTVFRDEVGQYIGLGVAAGISDSSDKAVKAAEKLAKDVYSRSKEWADRQVKYMDLSLKEQIALWETIQSQFIQDSEQYADAEEKLYDLRSKQQEEHYDELKGAADRLTKYQRLSLREQLETWRNIQNQLVKDSKQYLQAEEKVMELRLNLQDEYLDKVEDTNKKVSDLENKYFDELAKRQEAIANSYGLFDKVAEREEVSGKDLLGNLRDQVSVMKSFYKGVEELADRGLSKTIVDEIRAMGPAAEDELQGLLGLTDRELSEYANVYMEKQQLANQAALRELEDFKRETVDQIAENLQALKTYYDQNAPELGLSFTDGLVSGMLSGIADVRRAAASVAEAAVQSAGSRMSLGAPVAAYADIADTMVQSGAHGGGRAQEALEDAAKALREASASGGKGISERELANAMAGAMDGMDVNLDGQKVGRITRTRQEYDDRAFDR